MDDLLVAPLSENRLTRVEWVALAISILVAQAFFIRLLHYPSCCDAGAYVQAARDIEANGLFSKYVFSDLRTYAYPLFLSGVIDLANFLRLPFTLVVFELQLGFYVLAALALRRVIARQNLVAAQICFCGILFNYYCLLYTPERLTESLSLSLLLVAAACWLSLWKNPKSLLPLIDLTDFLYQS